MIIFDFRLGHLDLLVQREAQSAPFKVTREGPREVIIDWGRFAFTFANHSRLALV